MLITATKIYSSAAAVAMIAAVDFDPRRLI
jgi:hypothetical protein